MLKVISLGLRETENIKGVMAEINWGNYPNLILLYLS
jgi:hypothetical protein